MSETMRRLRQDHVNHSRLLSALERQLVAMESGSTVDWDIVRGIVEYCLAYPDLHHHPLEDRVISRLMDSKPAAASTSLGLLAEHRDLSASLRRVAAAVEQVLQDATVPRDWFTSLIRKFLNAQRDHIRREETEFYPAAERALTPSDWADLDEAAARILPDPLFGSPTDRRYRALLSDIRAGERKPN
jgi:hemerythrin-like domain-containing protein